jgi:hypothetical protein
LTYSDNAFNKLNQLTNPVTWHIVLLFAAQGQSVEVTPQRQLADYLQAINSPDFSESDLSLHTVATSKQYCLLQPLFQRLFCMPATSAPVERIFSQWHNYAPTQSKNE